MLKMVTFLHCIELLEEMSLWTLTSLQLNLIHFLAGDTSIAEKEHRCPRRPPCRRDHRSPEQGHGHQRNGQSHPSSDPTSSSASIVRVTAIVAQTERKQQDRSACHR